MLSDAVSSDLDLASIHSTLQLNTSWGKDTFTRDIHTPTIDVSELKQRQLCLLALHGEQTVREAIVKELSVLDCATVDQSVKCDDPYMKESVEQILWAPSSMASFLNTQSTFLNLTILWKSIVLPLLALIIPLVAIIVPFVFLNYANPQINIQDYLENVRGVLLKQITIPTILKSRGSDDRVGFLLESAFIGITLVTFISGIWNQISANVMQQKSDSICH